MRPPAPTEPDSGQARSAAETARDAALVALVTLLLLTVRIDLDHGGSEPAVPAPQVVAPAGAADPALRWEPGEACVLDSPAPPPPPRDPLLDRLS